MSALERPNEYQNQSVYFETNKVSPYNGLQAIVKSWALKVLVIKKF